MGQNNNIFVLFTLMKLVRQNYFTSFSHKFFMTGHSYNDCDRDFSQIEKKQRTANIIVPADLEEVIRDAKTNNPFEIKWMDQNLLLNFKQLITFFGRPATLQVTKYHWFRYDVATPNQIFTRELHRMVILTSQKSHHPCCTYISSMCFVLQEVWTVHNLVRGQSNGRLTKAYNAPIALAEAKKNDLRRLMEFFCPSTECFTN